MPIHDLFSKRNRPRRERLVYDALPSDFRSACARLFREALGEAVSVLNEMDAILRREHPSDSSSTIAFIVYFGAPKKRMVFDDHRLVGAYLSVGNFAEQMDAVEVAARGLDLLERQDDDQTSRCQTLPSMSTLGQDLPAIRGVPFFGCARLLTTARSPRPVFAPA